MKIDGKHIALEILKELKTKIAKLKKSPNLAIIIIGNNPSSVSYVEQKQLKAIEVGAKTTLIKLPSEISESELINLINKLNEDENVHGIIVQKPLPDHINDLSVNSTITPNKDVDGFNPNSKFDYPISLSVLEVLRKIYVDLGMLKSKIIVILGKGETGGEPIEKSLLKLNANPIVIDSQTENSEQIIKSADIVISAVGKKEIIKPQFLKKGVVLIGVGQHKEEDHNFHGDYIEEDVKDLAHFYTSTPGGIGPINVAMLLKNLVLAFETKNIN